MRIGNSISFYPVGPREVGLGRECLVVAEFGLNHNGSRERALEMVDAAAEAGCPAVKVQAYSTEEFCDPQATYTHSDGMVTERQFDMFKRCEFQLEDFQAIRDRARKRGLYWIATATDINWARAMVTLGVDALKVGSDDITHIPLLRQLRGLGVPVILSTGMANREEITTAVVESRAQAALHCVSLYPTPVEKASLGRMSALSILLAPARELGLAVGFSDHTCGVSAALVAIGFGAEILEKHFTLDPTLPGPDHRFSATPETLKAICDFAKVRQDVVDLTPNLDPQPEEREMATLARRSIVAARDLEPFHVLRPDDLAYRRPGTGLPPSESDWLVGKVTTEAVPAGGQITLAALVRQFGDLPRES